MLKLVVFLTYNIITMKRLYKIIILFLIIFFAGIYFTVKSINNSFSSDETIETVTPNSTLLKLSIKI